MHTTSRNGRLGLSSLLLTAVLTWPVSAPAAAQRTFKTAEDAVSALVEAAKAADRPALGAIFGPEAEQVLPSGDPVADREARELFVSRAGERTHLEHVGDDFAVLSIGNDDWPFAIPLTKGRNGWVFNTAAGKTELLNRRVGRNELYTIDVAQEYVAAQRDYARRRKAAGGVTEYAQRVRSTPGQRDGLYWEIRDGEEESPIGPLMASAAREGYGQAHDGHEPFHGYVFKILTAQGPHGPGGAHSYVENGRMTHGFGLVAYPVTYGSSGIMTFQVNQQGIVFQKDLGPKTAEIASQMNAYDPDDSWDAAD